MHSGIKLTPYKDLKCPFCLSPINILFGGSFIAAIGHSISSDAQFHRSFIATDCCKKLVTVYADKAPVEDFNHHYPRYNHFHTLAPHRLFPENGRDMYGHPCVNWIPDGNDSVKLPVQNFDRYDRV